MNIDHILLAALVKNPQSRFPDVKEFVSALERATREVPEPLTFNLSHPPAHSWVEIPPHTNTSAANLPPRQSLTTTQPHINEGQQKCHPDITSTCSLSANQLATTPYHATCQNKDILKHKNGYALFLFY